MKKKGPIKYVLTNHLGKIDNFLIFKEDEKTRGSVQSGIYNNVKKRGPPHSFSFILNRLNGGWGSSSCLGACNSLDSSANIVGRNPTGDTGGVNGRFSLNGGSLNTISYHLGEIKLLN
jgi:hypothetical protein